MDVKTEGLNGFEVAKRLRSISGHLKTPVILVAAHNDFDVRVVIDPSRKRANYGHHFSNSPVQVTCLPPVVKPLSLCEENRVCGHYD